MRIAEDRPDNRRPSARCFIRFAISPMCVSRAVLKIGITRSGDCNIFIDCETAVKVPQNRNFQCAQRGRKNQAIAAPDTNRGIGSVLFYIIPLKKPVAAMVH
nr:hypothetical protein [Burkholderia sp. BCC0405]